jgi:pyruvate/2-oxoglutarate dehydrogenase complex dihydrolipoamide acyltransferase (E2) component
MKLDRSRPFGWFREGAVLVYYGQDGRLFDPITDEMVKDREPAEPAVEPAAPATEPVIEPVTEPVAEPAEPDETQLVRKVVCKQCQREFAYSSDRTKKAAMTRMVKHLADEHGIMVRGQE